MGVKFAVAMGAEVTVFSTSPSKEADSKKLGASKFVLTTDESAVKALANSYDLILDTVSAKHEIIPYILALVPHGVFAIVGAPPAPYSVSGMPLILGNRTIFGSTIGGIKETQEMTDFCAENNITSDVEVIKMEQVDEAYERTLKSDVKYRFVIDVKAFKQ
uniref:C-terminal domain of a Zn Alcohol dehydrogenase n=1 Tax=uncultured eukaryote TaxID=100272 RepID=K7ZWD6_9EUKA|nr:C-terminal domain of a Zn Alcohol dehydrogenase [uncultured eukaryote]